MRAFSLGQPSRGATRRRSSRPKLAMARATMPMLSASCGSHQDERRRVARRRPAAGPCCAARRMPWRSLRRTRRAQNQYSSPAQVLASALEAWGGEGPFALTRQPHAAVADHDLLVPGDELVERLDPLPSVRRLQPGQVRPSASQRSSAQ